MTDHPVDPTRILDVDAATAQPIAARHVVREAADVVGLGTHIDATIDWAVRVGRHMPLPGDGRTAERFSALATAALLDVGAARVLEPHLDALAILAEAQSDGAGGDAARSAVGADAESSWGVYAAEGATRVDARESADGWMLDGTKPWCSLAGDLSHALVTAWVTPGERRLFAVALRDGTVRPHAGPWVSRGLTRIVSAAVDFRATPAAPVGAAGWYLGRPGFAWGGIGVAAVWWGGAVPLVQALTRAAQRDGADQLAFALLGEADTAMWAARAVLADAARRVDGGAPADPALADRVRGTVVAAVERVLTLAEHGLGPGPLTVDEEFARRVADLRIYVRQHHAERDAARLGRRVAGA